MNHHRITRRTFLAGSTVALGAAITGSASSTISAQDLPLANWEPLVTDGSGPAPRWDHLLVADETGNRLILFGGRDGAGAALNDTWQFDLATGVWSRLDIDGPAPRFGVAGSVDEASNRLYLFGGEDAGTFYNDSWRFDFDSQTWRQLNDGSSLAPSPRYGLGGVVDSNGNFLVSHGFTFDGRFNDTWSFDPRARTWTNVSPSEESRPLNRCLQEQVWDPTTNRMLLYGGCSSGFGPCPQGDLWSFDPEGQSWTNITPPTGPAARSNPGMTGDSTQGRSILFGGLTEAGYASDLWIGTFDGDAFSWTAIEQPENRPSARASLDAVQLGTTLYLFGGTSAEGTFNDLWSLTLDE
jgi:hypothetical protein